MKTLPFAGNFLRGASPARYAHAIIPQRARGRERERESRGREGVNVHHQAIALIAAAIDSFGNNQSAAILGSENIVVK